MTSLPPARQLPGFPTLFGGFFIPHGFALGFVPDVKEFPNLHQFAGFKQIKLFQFSLPKGC